MKGGRFVKPPTPEPPSLYCVECRKWVPSRERPRMFGKVELWECPACRAPKPVEGV